MTGVNLCQYKSDRHIPGKITGMTAHMPVKARNGPESGLRGDRRDLKGEGRGRTTP